MLTSQEIRLATEAVWSLVQAKKALGTHREDDSLCGKAIEEALSKIGYLFSVQERLEFWIRQDKILLGAQQVYYNPVREESLASLLFLEGLRRVTFEKGLSKEELTEFLRIIAIQTKRGSLHDDMVTLLWEEDFQHICFLIDESFLAESEGEEARVVARLQARDQLQGLSEAYADASSGADPGTFPDLALAGDEVRLLMECLERDTRGNKVEKLAAILFDMLRHADGSLEEEEAGASFRKILSFALREGDLRTFVEILKRAKDRAENPLLPQRARQNMGSLLSLVSSEELVGEVGNLFDTFRDIDEAALDEYIRLLDRRAIPFFTSLLGELQTIHGRKRAIARLIHIGERNIPSLARGLHDHRWYVVRNVVHILRHIGNRQVEECLLHVADHKDARVRREIMMAFGGLKSARALPFLKDALDDGDPLVRSAAARALGEVGSVAAKRTLLDKISAVDFGQRHLDEKKKFYEALATWRDRELVELMIGQLGKKTLFRGAPGDEDKACAAYCLGLMGAVAALTPLYGLKETRSPLLREYVETAIERIENAFSK